MYHSITFGDKNTYEDWHLVPSSRPLFNPPKPKTKIVDVPGANGVLDLSNTLTGYPVFDNREGSNEFIVLNDYWEWYDAYSTIMNYLHGRTMKAILEDDPDHYYTGRFSVNAWKSEKDWSRITIDYSVHPYKYSVNGKQTKRVHLTSDKSVVVTAQDYGFAPTIPTFRTTAEVTMKFTNAEFKMETTVTLNPGDNSFDDVIFCGSTCLLEFSLPEGTTEADVYIDFLEGSL